MHELPKYRSLKVVSMKKNFIVVFVSLVLAILIAVFLPDSITKASAKYETSATQNSIIEQNVTYVEGTPQEVFMIYNGNSLIGVLSNQKDLDNFLDTVYAEKYASIYPDSDISLGKDIYVVSERSYFSYENKDEEIFQYLSENELFSLKATLVEFSNDSDVYAQMYVTNEELYEEAMQEYLSYFVDADDLSLLLSGQETAELKTYDSRTVSVTISQTITMKEAYASADEIKTTKEEVIDYIGYGDNNEKEYYTVQSYDTLAGIGSKNNGLSATQVMNINRDKITNIDQVLSEGEELCVTYFTPLIDVVVMKENMKKETIYPDTVYVEDDTLRTGQTELVNTGVSGSKNSLYEEKWINGVLVNGTLESSTTTLQAVDEIVAVGTLEIPGYGTGNYRWPIENVYISCKWGCYVVPHVHQAIDIQNKYNLYGEIYAADRGVVEKNSYDSISGYYIVINHNNGEKTYYGHMSYRSPVEEGTIVDKGDYIGQIGMTGRATGPHVHFYIEKDGVIQDPCNGFLDCTVLQ